MKISYSNSPKKITGCVWNETSDDKSLSSKKKIVKAISKTCINFSDWEFYFDILSRTKNVVRYSAIVTNGFCVEKYWDCKIKI